MINKRHCWGVRVRFHQPRKQDGHLSQKCLKDTGVLRSLRVWALEYDKADAHAGRENEEGGKGGLARLAMMIWPTLVGRP